MNYVVAGFLLFLLTACSLQSSTATNDTKTNNTETNIAVLQVANNVFDQSQPNTLGLQKPAQIAHHLVFKAKAGSAQYNHGAVLFAFNGELFIQWQSSQQDEDAPETKILYSRSSNGNDWSEPQQLVAARTDALVTNGGWWRYRDTLVAFINVWPQDLQPKAGYVEYITSRDGSHWSKPKPLLDYAGKPVAGVIEQDLKQLPNGRILTAIHHQPGLIAKPFYTDDATGLSGWTQGEMENLPHQPGISRELEPSWFLTKQLKQQQPVMVFRDQGSSFTLLAARSNDNGKTWTKPTATNMPDSRAKQSAGNLPDGRAFLINNPSGTKNRAPLTITLSSDGQLFDKAYLLRSESELPLMLYAGKYKRTGYSYPKSIVWNNRVWVSYAVNKEDIEVTSMAVENL
ncbi:sialidase family protein [Cellvibrio sp. BR]|uniref:sialidase family protein n=1 Tax=Cellvibrio sp. BR TaxID=1134474 RepID=UPI000310E3E7|nr:sialidase family protein [Cellvibrio sp. BR]